MRHNEELIHTEEREGFTIKLYAADEDESPRGQFMREDGSDDEEIITKIELGEDFLGSCCYDSAASFVTDDGYYPDMVATAVEAAKATLARLCA